VRHTPWMHFASTVAASLTCAVCVPRCAGVVLLPPHRSARIDEGSSGGVDAASCDERAMAAGHSFSFDRVFHPASSQADVFQELEPLLKAAVAGRNVCIFAVRAPWVCAHVCVCVEGREGARALCALSA
jgi:hypothetical protein